LGHYLQLVKLHLRDFHNCLDSTLSLTPQSWYHIVATHDGERMRFSLNDKPAGEMNAQRDTISQSAFELFLGADQYNTPIIYTQGVVDDIRIYKRPLNETEIKASYQTDQ